MDSEQIFEQIHKLTNNNCEYIKCASADIVSSIFGQITNKNQAWIVLHSLISDKNNNVKLSGLKALISNFYCLPYKDQAWQDITQL